ncbi:meiosis inhibitor protein 1 isoform X3 [Synchiropus splendidus]|uniref:meiosis inhibitor protein 1 isoform X3 n=1 Tax=Synchiropus splendidus TaxID=270530 RepID=UPI00237E1EE4|nr:meiosis inhibitor protein 1 isoform X3 [Synchiropus splendidus]
MEAEDIVHEKLHFRHDSKSVRRLGPAEGGGLLVCVACIIEMMESQNVAVVRKSSALSGITLVLQSSPGFFRELLNQDLRLRLPFITSLLEMLHIVEDPATLVKVDQVLVLLHLELRNELPFHFVLGRIDKQLSDHLGVTSTATFNFVGNLVAVIPNMAQSLVTEYVPFLVKLCSALLESDEGLKASALYVWLQLFRSAGLLPDMLPVTIRDRLCVLLLQTFDNATSPQLTSTCNDLLGVLVRWQEMVSVLMNPGNLTQCDDNQNIHISNSQSLSQDLEQQPSDHCHLPLVLKKVLLSTDGALQLTSAKSIASVLAHSPSQYSAAFIKADIPELLFDHLVCTTNEVLLWTLYSCLVLLIEEPLFFSSCILVYGMENIVRSLKEALRMTNLEAAKQGLLLLTFILERQPANVRLFPYRPGFAAVTEALVCGVSSSCQLVATQAASAASALFRLNHQCRPVQYKEIQSLVEAITSWFSSLHLPLSPDDQQSMSLKMFQPSSLLQAMVCFQAACRLAEECASEPVLRENVFTPPSKSCNTLESLCQSLLNCCDTVWIPTVLRICGHQPHPQVLEYFYAILSSQFTLFPSQMPAFANKMASSDFYRMALEHKALLCVGNGNSDLNTACCGFLQKLSMCLLLQSDYASGSYQHEVEEVEYILQNNLPYLCCHLSDWPSLMSEAPGLFDSRDPRATQSCLVLLLHLALQTGNRLLPDQTTFTCVVCLLQSVQGEGDCSLTTPVLRSALYLLAVTQENSSDLDTAALNCIDKMLSSCQCLSSLYIHHAALLHFICRYPSLAEKFGPVVFELWLAKQADYTDAGPDVVRGLLILLGIRVFSVIFASLTNQIFFNICAQSDKTDISAEKSQHVELLLLLEKYPVAVLILLNMVCTREELLAKRALEILEAFLHSERDYEENMCTILKPLLLQALQRLSIETVSIQQGKTKVNSLPLLLRFLCVTQACDTTSSCSSNMDDVNFKLLYLVSSIVGRLKPTDTESLLPGINFLYCCLTVSPAYSTDRTVSTLLSNSALIDLLQSVLSFPAPPSALLTCTHLLLASLIPLQHLHCVQVQKCISWSLDSTVQQILLQKRNTDNLLLVSCLRLLQAILDVDMVSTVLDVRADPKSGPMEAKDRALSPLTFKRAQMLSIALNDLLLQKHEPVLRAAVNCFSSLLSFLQHRSSSAASFHRMCAARSIVCQPWNRFLLYCLFSSGPSCQLHPAILRLITLLLQHGGTFVVQQPDLLQVMNTAESRGVQDLSLDAAEALTRLLTQIQSSMVNLPPTEVLRVKSLLETLSSVPPTQRPSSAPLSSILYPACAATRSRLQRLCCTPAS